MNTRTLALLTAALTFTGSTTAFAQNNVTEGPYVGVSLGASGVGFETIERAEIGENDQSGTAGKVSAGYWISRHLGVEANYSDLGDFSQQFAGGTWKGSAKSYGVSLLGRLPVGERWSFVGKLNLTRAEVDDNGSTGNTAGFDQFNGDSTSLVLPGLEVNYSFTPRSTVFLELDPRGSGGDKLDLGYVGVGWRVAF